MNSSSQSHKTISPPLLGRVLPIVLAMVLTSVWPVDAQSAWQVTLQISIPDPAADSGNASNKLILGVDPAATDSFDNSWDTVAYTGGSLNAYFSHPEYALSKTQLWQDLRADRLRLPKTWEVEASSQLEGQARLTWDAAAVPSQIDLTLVDAQTGSSIDMKTASEYTFPATPSTDRKFSVQASEKTLGGGSGTPPPQTSGGGGCGMIRDAGRKGGFPPPTGTVAWNMALLFSPLIWLAFRRIAFSGVFVCGSQGRLRSIPKGHEEKIPISCGFPASFIDPARMARMRRRGGRDRWR